MEVLSKIEDKNGDKSVYFWCPGCDGYHSIYYDRVPGSKGPKWTWNGDMEKPTFAPSLLVRSVSTPDPILKDDDGEYILGPDGRLKGAKDTVCHSFIREGVIMFLNDCTHELKGKPIPLEEFK